MGWRRCGEGNGLFGVALGMDRVAIIYWCVCGAYGGGYDTRCMGSLASEVF